MVGREDHVGLAGEQLDRLGQVMRPDVRVADQGPAQGQQVVQVVGGVLGHAQRFVAREIEVHLGGRLGAGRHLELDLDAVDGVLLTGGGDIDGGHDDRHLARGRRLTQATPHLSLRATVECGAIHVPGPPRHRGTGVDVLLDSVFGEPFRRQHRDLARVDVGLRRDTEHATEMVDMAVGVDHRDDGALPAVCAIERQGGGRRLRGHQWVDDDDPGVALDEADVGQIQAAHLVDAFDDFVQTLLGAQLGLPPQARVHRGGWLAGEERVAVVVPDDPTVGGLDHTRTQCAEEPPVGVVEIGGVVERQGTLLLGMRGFDDRGGRILLHTNQRATARLADNG